MLFRSGASAWGVEHTSEGAGVAWPAPVTRSKGGRASWTLHSGEGGASQTMRAARPGLITPNAPRRRRMRLCVALRNQVALLCAPDARSRPERPQRPTAANERVNECRAALGAESKTSKTCLGQSQLERTSSKGKAHHTAGPGTTGAPKQVSWAVSLAPFDTGSQRLVGGRARNVAARDLFQIGRAHV